MSKHKSDREYEKFKETTEGETSVRTFSINQLIPEEFDSIVLGYTGEDLTTLTYYTGGTGGTAVATLTLTYSGGKIESIAKT